jgi:hypothetical protein
MSGSIIYPYESCITGHKASLLFVDGLRTTSERGASLSSLPLIIIDPSNYLRTSYIWKSHCNHDDDWNKMPRGSMHRGHHDVLSFCAGALETLQYCDRIALRLLSILRIWKQ